MNAYIADQLAREHADRLMADAAAARRVRLARRSRRAAASATRTKSAADRPHAAARPGAAAAAQFVARPITALRSWLVAGQL